MHLLITEILKFKGIESKNATEKRDIITNGSSFTKRSVKKISYDMRIIIESLKIKKFQEKTK